MPKPPIPCVRPWRDVAEEACRENDHEKLAELFRELQVALAEPTLFEVEQVELGRRECASTTEQAADRTKATLHLLTA